MSDQSGNAIFYLALLILPLSALIARRLPLGQLAKMALGWAGIFAVALLLVTLWTRNRPAIDDLLVSTGLKQHLVRGGSITLARNEDGHFYADVMLNGQPHRLMIDSGATETAISAELAKRIGVRPADRVPGGEQTMVETANGTITAEPGTIETVTLGPITARDLGVLVAPSFGDGVLGMNFLNQLKGWRVEGDRMILNAPPTAPGDSI
ncbi:TIGR02281 family clan AA aspartic protease [Sphingomonas sp.]|uniref:retropepsin-like aspartic protease family protein n=1 Tax=Sphingomonas sp. TaxID=28214 RepID=UPI001D4BFC75|nr:TIGR02281 family clan AA aspartic protease [Sphingomonas sp.]MBX9796406.1 TIGR02281 family clan AA aspartic protease [Sphingomonas sp.]